MTKCPLQQFMTKVIYTSTSYYRTIVCQLYYWMVYCGAVFTSLELDPVSTTLVRTCFSSTTHTVLSSSSLEGEPLTTAFSLRYVCSFGHMYRNSHSQSFNLVDIQYHCLTQTSSVIISFNLWDSILHLFSPSSSTIITDLL